VETVARDMNYFFTIPSILAFKVIRNKVHMHSNTRAVYKMC
jgi:hypothetical protein